MIDWLDDAMWWFLSRARDVRVFIFPPRYDPVLWATAEKLADRPYLTVCAKQTDPPIEWCWLAYHPDLEGCMMDGRTPDEAKARLNEVRAEWIYHLLAYDIPVPIPQQIEGVTVISIDPDRQEWLTPKYEEGKK